MVQVRRLFAGSNGAKGFHSFFQYVFRDGARRVYLLKGGPGTGKSSLMKNLATVLQDAGLALELFYCSSDSRSLDAVACPELGVAVVDATFPHEQDPKLPGCFEEIINLGAFWDASKLVPHRNRVAAAGKAKAACFATAFNYFAAALAVEEVIALRSAGNGQDCSSILEELLQEVHKAGKPVLAPRQARHLFASALTPEGFVSEVADLSSGYRRFILVGPPGAGQANFLRLLVSQAELMGLEAEAFHYPLNPDQVLHLLLPDLNLAVLTATLLDPLDALDGQRIVCGSEPQGAALARDHELFAELVASGFAALRDAQSGHGEVEQLYSSAMDFAAVDEVFRRLTSEILAYRIRS